MPVITVEMWKGRTPEQKKAIAQELSDVFIRMGVPAEQVWVILKDNEKSNWAISGKLCG